MKDLMFWGMFFACLSVLVMASFVLYMQYKVNIDLRNKYNELRRELNNCFGWEDWEWAHNFREYARKVEELIKFKKEIEQLEIIKKALEVKSLEELQKKKEHIESVIKTLEK